MNEFFREMLFLPPQESSVAADIDFLHYLVISCTMIGSGGVALVALYFIVRYRHSQRPEETRAERSFTMPLSLEVGFIGGLSFMFLAFWWIGVRQYMEVREPPEESVEVYVVAKQWMWKFTYPEGNSTVSTLKVPAGVPIKLLMTSRDVIHSFFVPEFRVKQDVLPGRYTTMWFEIEEPGVYPVLCTEYCGDGHSVMRAEVEALPPREYSAWMEGQRTAGVEPEVYTPPFVVSEDARSEPLNLVVLGQRVAAQYGCLRCHTTDGSPHIGPSFGGLYGSKVELKGEEPIVADEAYITESMMDPLAHLAEGYEPVMPPYQGLLRPGDTAAIVEFIRALRDIERMDVPRPGPPAAPARPPLDIDQPYPPPAAGGRPTYPEPAPTPIDEEELP